MGDFPPGQSKKSRDGPVQGKSTAERNPGSTRSQSSSRIAPPGPQQLRRTQPIHRMLRPAGVEYYPGSHGYISTGSYGTRPTLLNMAEMSSALPAYQSPTMPFGHQVMHQQFMPAHPSQGLMYSVQQLPFPGQGPGGGTVYNVPYSPAYQNPYAQQHHQQDGAPGFEPHLPTHQGCSPVSGQTPAYGPSYYPQHPYATAFGPGQAVQGARMRKQPGTKYYRPQGTPLPVQVPSRKEGERQKSAPVNDVCRMIVDGSSPRKSARAHPHSPEAIQTVPSTQRRPSRKPKQSGHALWVGNIPPGANVVDLKDHFCRDATNDIESVFLISKSNCAFVNYKTEAACNAAMARFHDSRFHGARLVCRLRRGLTVPGSGNNQSGATAQSSRVEDETSPLPEQGGDDVATDTRQTPSRLPERFFIIKSLTVEDLELSRRSGIWATQIHNEVTLNKAYESADNVYLIFSANRSGEYFGYARMSSPIRDDDALALEMPSRPEKPSADAEKVNVTLTEATTTAPKGRIIEDSARGTIFWEVDSSEEEDNNDDSGTKREKSIEETDAENAAQSFGKPFRIEWISTQRVPFYRTRGLRNPWNANREVKIARDGTEIEPSVGRKLTQLFHLQPGQTTPCSIQPHLHARIKS
ncbi:hypothetical protein VTN77DRAFT_1678 [Rasamsonia byssochlamydoides]|uniref:uncharacterized protein n=1 Tax=Rasamsonia byssochlamydoides TaxID=89139 RepID=UPI003743FADF